MMLGTKHIGCGGILQVAKNVTEQEEIVANTHEDAAILSCAKCAQRVVDNATSSRPDRYRKKVIPDQSVFEVRSGKQR